MLREKATGILTTTNGFDVFIYLTSEKPRAMLEYYELEGLAKKLTFVREEQNRGKYDRAKNIKFKAEYVIKKLIRNYNQEIRRICKIEKIETTQEILYDPESTPKEIINYLAGFVEGAEVSLRELRKDYRK